MPKEIPGFYFDEEKNRYFPIKGPIPGKRKLSAISSYSEEKSNTKSKTANKAYKSLNIRGHKLLHFRELSGNLLPSTKGRLNFRAECEKKIASEPSVWRYPRTVSVESALEQIKLQVNMPAGATTADFLVAGSTTGDVCFFELGKVAEEFHNGDNVLPKCIWSCNNKQFLDLPPRLWRPSGAFVRMPSYVSCVKASPFAREDDKSSTYLLVTTLGSGFAGGSIYIWDLRVPLDLYHGMSFPFALHEIYSIEDTIWSADFNYDGTQAVIGRNRGASILDLETATTSWVYRCKSDALSTKYDNSGKVILCGLRSGEIVTLDTRQKPRDSRSRPRIPRTYNSFPSAERIYGSCEICLPSSVSCLAPLRHYDQYLLASSMDGAIRLYDRRQIQRGFIQSYDGNINSHTRIQLGVDPSERFFMSGGEDCKIRMWCIKSGEMLFEAPLSSVPSAVCWPRTGGQQSCDYWQNHQWGAWLGSLEGIFYMKWP